MAFGGVIKLQGESEYRAALKQIQNSLAVVGSEMQKVSSQFAKGEKSIKSLTAVNEVLNKKLLEQKKAVAEASKMLTEAQSKYDDSSKSVEKWEQELADAKKALEAAKNSTTASAAEIEKLENNVKDCEKGLQEANTENQKYATTVQKWQTELNKAEAAVNKTTREIKENENAIEALESSTKEAADEVDYLADSMDDLSDSENKAKSASEKANSGFTVLKGTLANLASQAISKAVDAMKDFAGSMIEAAAEVKASGAQFEQTFGDLQGEASAALDRVGKSTGILKTRLQDSASGIYAFAKASGADSAEAMKLMETALMATADSAAYYDKSLEESAETLQSFLKGNFANDAALGLSATEFTRNAKAAELFGKKYNDLTEIQKQQTLLQMVVDAQKASGAFGQASREADGWANVQGNLNESWKQFKANVGTPFLEALIPVIQSVTDKLSSLSESIDWQAFRDGVGKAVDTLVTGFGWIVDHGDTIIAILAGIVAGIAAFKVVVIVQTAVAAFTALTTAIKSVGLAQAALNVIMAANPIGLIVAAIAGLVTAFVVLWNKSEKFRNFFKGMWEEIKKVVEKIVGAIVNFFKNAWDNIKAVWDAVTGFFSGIWDGIKEVFSAVGNWFKERFYEAVQNIVAVWTAVHDFFQGIWDGIKNIFSSIGNWFKDKFKEALNNVIAVWLAVHEFFEGIWEGIKNVFASIGNWFKEKFQEAVDNIKAVFITIVLFVEEVREKVKNVFANIGNWFKERFQEAVDNIKAVFSVVGDFFSEIWDKIKNTISEKIETIKLVITTVFNAVKDFITKVWDNIKSSITEKIEAVKIVVSTVVNTIKDVVSNVFNTVKNTVSNVWNGIKDTISNAINGAKNTVSNVVDGIKSKVTGVFDAIKNTVSNVWNGIKNTISNTIEGARDKVKAAIDKIKGFFKFDWELPKIKLPHFSITGKFGLDPPQIPKFSVDWYAKAMKKPMLLDSPTIFGMQGNKLLGAGEAGSEVVSGAETLMEMIKEAVRLANDQTLYTNITSGRSIEAPRTIDDASQYSSIISAFKEALREVKVEMDSDEMGKFVERTVADAIYT